MFPNRLASVCLHGQFVSAVTQGHERTAKGMPIDFARYLYQTTGSEKLGRFGPDDIDPTAFIGTLFAIWQKIPYLVSCFSTPPSSALLLASALPLFSCTI
jgi:hypothetical protein